jgi:integrase
MPTINLDRNSVKELLLPPGETVVFYWDTTLKGFGVKVRADADGVIQKSFVIQYRFGNKQRKIKLGDVGKLNAGAARDRAEKLFGQIINGHDPAAEKEAARAASAITLQSVIDQYLRMKEHAVHEGKHRASSLRITRLYLTGKAYFGPLHSTAINAIGRADIATRLNAMIVENGSSTADRARAHLSAFWVWAMQQGIAEANPVIGTAKPETGPAKDRVLNDDELREVWNACKDDEYGKIVRLLMLTACRRMEIGGLRWSEVDLEKGTVTIAAERSKNHRAHTLPLSGMALDILRSIPQMVSRDFVFGIRGEGFTLWPHVHLADGVAKWTLHDLRRSAATGMADLGIHPHVIEAILNHTSGHKAGVAGIYNRSTYAREMKNALAVWADHIRSIVDGAERKVVPLRA